MGLSQVRLSVAQTNYSQLAEKKTMSIFPLYLLNVQIEQQKYLRKVNLQTYKIYLGLSIRLLQEISQ